MADLMQAKSSGGGDGASSLLAAVSASHVSELGKALDQTTISSTAGSLLDASHQFDDEEGDDADEGDEEDDYEEGDGDEYGQGEYGDDDGEGTEDGDDFGMAGGDDDDDDDNDEHAASPVKEEAASGDAGPLKNLPVKSQKRGRTDSLKKMLPAPASQRHKQKNGDGAAAGDCTIEDAIAGHKPQPAKLLVKDRTGAGMGTPRPHLISNAVKQAPPAKEKSNPRRWSKHEGHWTPEEDSKLRELVTEEKKNWGQVASLIPGRTSYTEDEDKIIIEMQAKLGNRWSIIAQQLKGRTEDAVKIRWKSLMRGRRAALKDEKSQSASSSITSPSTEAASSEKPKAKASKSTPARQKTRAASPVIKAEKDVVPTQVDQVKEPSIATVPSTTDLEPADLSASSLSAVDSIDTADLAAAMSSIQSVDDDLVATSIHNFQMSQRFHHQSNGVNAATSGVYSNPNASQTMSPANHAMYSAPNGYLPPQQSSYQVQQDFNPMQTNPSMPQNYGMPTNFGTSAQMTMSVQGSSMSQPMQFYPGLSSGMNTVPQGFSQPGFAAPQRAMYQAQNTGMGFSGGVYTQPGAPVPNQNYNAMQANLFAANFALHPSAASGLPPTSNGMNIGLPPSSAAAAAKMLNTPREEWGSSQTPRSQMILTEGHASAYELFHQQRVRLMLQEREKHGLTLSSAPSPGQAMLTKELEANKERQKRQAIMQKGWKSAVEAMMAYNSDLTTLDDQQGFDGFLEKVTLSALDPTDEELIGDIIAGDDSIEMIENPVE